MEFSVIVRDRLFRKLEPLVGAEEAEHLMSSLPPGGWAEVATKSDLVVLTSDLRSVESTLRAEIATARSELKADISEFRSELKTDIADMRSEMVTRSYLSEQLRLHVDARVGAISRTWLFATAAMQAATIGGIVAAIRI